LKKKIRPRSRTPPPAGVWSGRPRRRLLWPEGAPRQDWPRRRFQGPAEQPPPGPGNAEPPPAGLGCASRQIWPCRAATRRAGPRLPPDLATPGRHPPGLAAPPAKASCSGAPPAEPGRALAHRPAREDEW